MEASKKKQEAREVGRLKGSLVINPLIWMEVIGEKVICESLSEAGGLSECNQSSLSHRSC